MTETLAGGAARIAQAFETARGEGRAALMPYMMGGFPDPQTSQAVADAYAESGADLVELGVPFSDPLADGPVIHTAGTRALASGATLEGVLEIGKSLAEHAPFVPMVYSNMALARGVQEFAAMLASGGAAGAIIPDLPLGEEDELGDALRDAGVAPVPLIAPTTTPERRRRICEGATGFIYLVSDTRVTGERDDLPAGLTDLVEAVRAESAVPVAVGFGIGTPEQAASVGRIADGVIVGTRLVRAVAEADGPAASAAAVSEFIRAAREAMASAGGPVG
jgi:tryptophan synthase alpha chain